MPIKVTCDECSKTINAPDKSAGKTAKCPGCQAPLKIPALEDELNVSDLDETIAIPPPKKKSRDAGGARSKGKGRKKRDRKEGGRERGKGKQSRGRKNSRGEKKGGKKPKIQFY